MKRDIATAEVLTHRVVVAANDKQRAANAPVIIQKQYTKESVLTAYDRLGDLQAVCLETGCPPYVAFKWVKFAGLMKRKDSMKYGNNSSKIGALTEIEFKRLVPFAMDANKHLENNCQGFDFDINGTTVDVKFSRLHASGKYIFATAASKEIKPDYFVVFCAPKGAVDLKNGYTILVIPNDVLGDIKRAYITPGNMYWDFAIAPEDLAGFFEDYL